MYLNTIYPGEYESVYTYATPTKHKFNRSHRDIPITNISDTLFRLPLDRINSNSEMLLYNQESQRLVQRECVQQNKTTRSDSIDLQTRYSGFLQKYKQRLKREHKKHLRQQSEKSKYIYDPAAENTKIMSIINSRVEIKQTIRSISQAHTLVNHFNDSPKSIVNSEKAYQILKEIRQNKGKGLKELNLPMLRTSRHRDKNNNSTHNFEKTTFKRKLRLEIENALIVKPKKTKQATIVEDNTVVEPWASNNKQDEFIYSDKLLQ